MKSAYELAMERLEKESGPTRKLNEEQKRAISEIDKTYDARIAEQNIDFDARIASAPFEEQPNLREELANTIASLEEKREREKQAIWDAG